MKQAELFTKSVLIGLFTLIWGSLNAQGVQAQRAISLTSSSCAPQPNIMGSGWGTSREDVSIGRELYTTILYVGPGTSFSCRVPPGMAGNLNLQFGIKDGSNGPPLSLSVYLDGNEEARKIVSPGQTSEIIVDVSNSRSIAIEATCTRAYCSSSFLFFKAQFEPLAASPGQR